MRNSIYKKTGSAKTKSLKAFGGLLYIMSEEMELKATKMLLNIYSGMFSSIRQTARNCVEYRKDKPDEVFKEMEHIANPAKWDYCGLLNKEDKAILETLEYLLNDDMKEVRKYKHWQPTER